MQNTTEDVSIVLHPEHAIELQLNVFLLEYICHWSQTKDDLFSLA